MPEWYADKSMLLSATMYESFGLNIGEAKAALMGVPQPVQRQVWVRYSLTCRG